MSSLRFLYPTWSNIQQHKSICRSNNIARNTKWPLLYGRLAAVAPAASLHASATIDRGSYQAAACRHMQTASERHTRHTQGTPKTHHMRSSSLFLELLSIKPPTQVNFPIEIYWLKHRPRKAFWLIAILVLWPADTHCPPRQRTTTLRGPFCCLAISDLHHLARSPNVQLHVAHWWCCV